MKKIAIVGAGISGLATAFYLRRALKAAGTEAELVIFESGSEPGGTMRTSRERDFVMEWGPNGFLTNKPYALELVRENGIEAHLLRSSDQARKRFVFSGGRMHRLPETPGAFLFSDLLSVAGRARVMAEPFISPQLLGDDESVAEFARRRLGGQAADKLIEPMTAGIFAGNADELSLTSCFPRIRELETRYGGLVKAMLRLRWQRRADGAASGMSAGPGGILTSFDTGVQALVDVLAGEFSHELRLNSPVENVVLKHWKYQLTVKEAGGRSQCEADAVVVAAPAYAACVMLKGLDKALASELERIPYVPVTVAALGYGAGAVGKPLDGFGFLVPRLENRKILGALWDSSVFANRAPSGQTLVRVMVGGARQPELAGLDEEKLIGMVREELKGLMGITAKPLLSRVFFHGKGIPQYLKGHGKLLERVEARLTALPGLQLNSNAYRGVSLNDCVLQSKLAAERVVKSLK